MRLYGDGNRVIAETIRTRIEQCSVNDDELNDQGHACAKFENVRWFREVADRFAVFMTESMERICAYADGLKRTAIARLQLTWLASVIFLETDGIFGYNVRKSRRIWNANRFSISIRVGRHDVNTESHGVGST